jgi:hypothetical protein
VLRLERTPGIGDYQRVYLVAHTIRLALNERATSEKDTRSTHVLPMSLQHACFCDGSIGLSGHSDVRLQRRKFGAPRARVGGRAHVRVLPCHPPRRWDSDRAIGMKVCVKCPRSGGGVTGPPYWDNRLTGSPNFSVPLGLPSRCYVLASGIALCNLPLLQQIRLSWASRSSPSHFSPRGAFSSDNQARSLLLPAYWWALFSLAIPRRGVWSRGEDSGCNDRMPA